MTERVWTSRREISGFGGGYEAECRAMVMRGVAWFDENPDADPRFHGLKDVFGIIIEDNDDAKAMTKAMLGTESSDHTGAMVQATTGHVMHIKRNGWTWEEYMSEMDRFEDEEEAGVE